jgi:hypothetical protein
MSEDEVGAGLRERPSVKRAVEYLDMSSVPPGILGDGEAIARWTLVRSAKAIAWALLGVNQKLTTIGKILEERLELDCKVENISRDSLQRTRNGPLT